MGERRVLLGHVWDVFKNFWTGVGLGRSEEQRFPCEEKRG